MIYSTQRALLYQIRPKKRNRPLGYTENGWYTQDGNKYEADKLPRCVEWSRRHYFTDEFTFFVSINFTQDLDAGEFKALWQKACRYLKNHGVVGLYVTEVSRRSNRFNIHRLTRSDTPNLKQLLKFSTRTVRTNIQVRPYNPRRGKVCVRYMTKAKTAKYRNGYLVSKDRWASKRVLLRQELKVRKYGTIGDFWPKGKNTDDLWNEIIAQERNIKEGMGPPGAEEYAGELYDLIAGYWLLNRVRRSVGFFGVPAHWCPSPDLEGDTLCSPRAGVLA